MPAPTTIPDFLLVVRKSGLVQPKSFDAFVEQFGDLPAQPARAEDGSPVGRVASVMVRRGLLSIFQAEKLLEGKWRGFTVGNYKVLERLGKGGLGNVYLCEHQFTRQRLAVKILRGANVDDPIAVKRFYREAQAAAALTHPNIVRAYDVGQDDQLHFLVMDYVDGSSLQTIVERQGPMNVLRAAHYIRQTALGLQYAHEAAFVHRDIKPGNVLLDRRGTVKILDMGLARISQEEDVDVLTRCGDVLGSADYLAPEQARDSHGVDIRADIYGLGCTCYFLLTGLPPFSEAKTVAQKLIFKQTRKPRSIRAVRAEVPQPLAEVVEKMMATNPETRYATPEQVARALAPFTQTPIPPPPLSEMPQRSPAVLGPADAHVPRSMSSRDSSPSILPKAKASSGRAGHDTPSPFLRHAPDSSVFKLPEPATPAIPPGCRKSGRCAGQAPAIDPSAQQVPAADFAPRASESAELPLPALPKGASPLAPSKDTRRGRAGISGTGGERGAPSPVPGRPARHQEASCHQDSIVGLTATLLFLVLTCVAGFLLWWFLWQQSSNLGR